MQAHYSAFHGFFTFLWQPEVPVKMVGSVLGDARTQSRDCPRAISSQKHMNVALQVWELEKSEIRAGRLQQR